MIDASCDLFHMEWHLAVLSCVWLLVTPWTVAHQPPLSMEFSRQEYWSRLPFPPPGDLPHLGIEPVPPALAGGFFTTEPPGKPSDLWLHRLKYSAPENIITLELCLWVNKEKTFGSAYILKPHVSAKLKVIWKFGLVSNFSTIFVFFWEKILDPRNNDTFKTVVHEPKIQRGRDFFLLHCMCRNKFPKLTFVRFKISGWQ